SAKKATRACSRKVRKTALLTCPIGSRSRKRTFSTCTKSFIADADAIQRGPSYPVRMRTRSRALGVAVIAGFVLAGTAGSAVTNRIQHRAARGVAVDVYSSGLPVFDLRRAEPQAPPLPPRPSGPP